MGWGERFGFGPAVRAGVWSGWSEPTPRPRSSEQWHARGWRASVAARQLGELPLGSNPNPNPNPDPGPDPEDPQLTGSGGGARRRSSC